MSYQLGDVLTISGTLCEIGFINYGTGYAWLFPLEDKPYIFGEDPHLRHIAFAKLEIEELTALDLNRSGAV
jgi:hypothetical protein